MYQFFETILNLCIELFSGIMNKSLPLTDDGTETDTTGQYKEKKLWKKSNSK